MQTKVCTKCKAEKELTEFSMESKTGKYRAACKECLSSQSYNLPSRVKQREESARRKEEKQKAKEAITHKVCTACGFTKSLDQFYTYPDGHTLNQCNDCKSIKRKERYYSNQEEEIEKAKEWNKVNHNRVVENGKKYREKNKDKLNEQSREYRKNNLEFCKELHRKWVEANPDKKKQAEQNWVNNNRDKVNAKVRNRSAKKKKAIGEFSSDDVKLAYVAQGGKCLYCNCYMAKYTIDHIYPINCFAYNGSENIQLLCKSCNSSKSDVDPIVYETNINFITPEREEFLLQLRNFIEEKLNESQLKIAA